MISAYVLIQTEVGRSTNVGQAVAAIEGVTRGRRRALRRDRAGGDVRHGRAGRLVIAKLQMVEDVTRPLTCPVVHF